MRSFPVVVVTGLRQSGKTTFLQHEVGSKDHKFVSLDDFAALEAARQDPVRFVEQAERLIIDEAQHCPELFQALKRVVDGKRRNGRFVISGSANFLLLQKVSESLAGRAAYLTLHPLNRRELTSRTSAKPFLAELAETGELPKARDFKPIGDRDVLLGGMPPVALDIAAEPDRWFEAYERTYLERDVRELSQVADLLAYRRVMKLAALRTGQMSNWTAIAQEAKVASRTASKYLDLLQVSYVLSSLGPHLANRKSRLLKTPKLYVSDSGLAANLCGVDDISTSSEERMRGPLYETFVAQNLRSILEIHLRRATLGYWNVQGRHEVDFVVATRRRNIAIEVKAGPRFERSDFAGLRTFASGDDKPSLLVLATQGDEPHAVGPNEFVVPIGMLLS
ncbi:MAG: ATP-binding protein [Planctomycetes bacterium]|nr:ATP-binding protein [Planctomycetota bacterium]